MRFHFTILAFALFYTYVVSYSINVDDLPAFFDDDDDDEVSRPELETFMERFGMDYGYNGTLDTILQTDLRHNHDAVYLDYTGAGMYRDSQIRECEKQLVNHLYGNAHSRSPSSIKTENEVRVGGGFPSGGEYSRESIAFLQCRSGRVHSGVHQRRDGGSSHDRRVFSMVREIQILLSR